MSARHAALLGLLAALWGSSYLLIKYALDGFSPAEIVFGRAALAAVVLVPLCALRGGATRARLADVRRRPGLALGLGTLFVAAPFLLISFGELRALGAHVDPHRALADLRRPPGARARPLGAAGGEGMGRPRRGLERGGAARRG